MVDTRVGLGLHWLERMMPSRLLTRSNLLAIGLVMLVRLHALADATPQPSPSPTPPVRTGWAARLDGMSSFVDQATRGPGTRPPEGAAFAAGDPLSPLTPYEISLGLRAINYAAMFVSHGVFADRKVGSGITLQFLHDFCWHSSVWIMRPEDGPPASLPLGW
jgi:hypothetical protein